MPTVVGIWIALAGGLAAVAGLSGFRRPQRLRGTGVKAWALAVRQPAAIDEQAAPRRPLLQYTLADGRVLETLAPRTARKAGSLRPGQKVLVWYDPADPADILVYGREGRVSDAAFVITGAVFILGGACIAVFGA
jgi:hypothetical protein